MSNNQNNAPTQPYNTFPENIFNYPHNSEHTNIHIIITKTRYISKFYQQAYPTYDLMGASDRDMQRGTILVFELDWLNLKGLLRKGPRIRKRIPYFDVYSTHNRMSDTLSKSHSCLETPTPPDGKLLPLPNIFAKHLYMFWLYFSCELFKCEELWLCDLFL